MAVCGWLLNCVSRSAGELVLFSNAPAERGQTLMQTTTHGDHLYYVQQVRLRRGGKCLWRCVFLDGRDAWRHDLFTRTAECAKELVETWVLGWTPRDDLELICVLKRCWCDQRVGQSVAGELVDPGRHKFTRPYFSQLVSCHPFFISFWRTRSRTSTFVCAG